MTKIKNSEIPPPPPQVAGGILNSETNPQAPIGALALRETGEAIKPEGPYTKRFETRFETVFKPLFKSEDDARRPIDDYYGMVSTVQSEPGAHEINDARYVNAKTKKEATSTLELVKGLDPKIVDLIPPGVSDEKAVDLIRTNAGIRLRFAEYLTRKLDAIIAKRWYQFPSRILQNSEKSPTPAIYGGRKYTSREYVVLLALSKLDGSFSSDLEELLPKDDHNGVAVLGQHRATADMLLGISNRPAPQ